MYDLQYPVSAARCKQCKAFKPISTMRPKVRDVPDGFITTDYFCRSDCLDTTPQWIKDVSKALTQIEKPKPYVQYTVKD